MRYFGGCGVGGGCWGEGFEIGELGEGASLLESAVGG